MIQMTAYLSGREVHVVISEIDPGASHDARIWVLFHGARVYQDQELGSSVPDTEIGQELLAVAEAIAIALNEHCDWEV
jgi:hypothetical protein